MPPVPNAIASRRHPGGNASRAARRFAAARRSVSAGALFLLALPLLLAAGCSRKPAAPPPVRGALLVTVEGDLAPLLPHDVATPEWALDRGLFGGEVRYVSSEVLPSAASALTGLLPPQHGLRTDGVGTLAPAVPTLATRFAAKGWDCSAFLGTPALSSVHGLDRGFSVYSAAIDPTNRAGGFLRAPGALAREATARLDSLPRGKEAFVWLHLAASPRGRNPLAQSRDEVLALLRRFSNDSPVLFLSVTPSGADGLSIPGDRVAHAGASASTGVLLFGRPQGSAVATAGPSVADAPLLLGFGERQAPLYAESLVPWYAFRLPPLERRSADCPVSVLDGLAADPVAVPLAHQSAMAVLRANGHLGEGLVPPYTNGVALAALDEAGEARVARWRAAMAAPATSRVAALRALVESDPDVPLFHHELGEALLRERDFTGACNELAAASRLGWNMVLANRLQARCHAAIGNVPAAIDRAEAAFLVNEGDPVPRRELAELLLRTGSALLASGDLRESKECLDRALLLAPGHPAARLESARLELRAGDTNAAVERLRLLLRDRPGDKPAQALLRSLPHGSAAP